VIKQGLLPSFEPRSFLLMLAAFIGNATLLGMDIALVCILPTILLMQIGQRWSIPKQSLPTMFVIMLLLVGAAARSSWIGIPYTNEYHLWAWKALFLTVLVAFGRKADWPVGNTTVLAVIVVALVGMGRIEDGRLYSVFGPNMLYRIFGLLLVFSVMERFEASFARRLVMTAFIVVAAYSILLTGSVGSLAMLAIAGAVIVYRYSKRLFFLLVLLVGIGLSGALRYSTILNSDPNMPVIVSRLAYKWVNLAASSRFENWSAIVSSPFSMFGHSYADFSSNWSYQHQYPHNIFFELYGFYGVIGIGISIVIIGAVFVALRRLQTGDSLAITYFVLLIGTLFSGDLTDNYGVVGLAAGLLVRYPNGSDDVTAPRRHRCAKVGLR
jgi:hypothetical protein